MTNPLSADITGILITKLEKEVVYPTNPILFKRYVDGISNHKKKREEDKSIPLVNTSDPKIKFTVEVHLSKFPDTKLK